MSSSESSFLGDAAESMPFVANDAGTHHLRLQHAAVQSGTGSPGPNLGLPWPSPSLDQTSNPSGACIMEKDIQVTVVVQMLPQPRQPTAQKRM